MLTTPLGTVCIIEREAIFRSLTKAVNRVALGAERPTVGLTGGSTPKAWYQWLSAAHASGKSLLSAEAIEKVCWSCSDERWVSLDDAESNFGNAQRGFLENVGVSATNCFPWPFEGETPGSSILAQQNRWAKAFGSDVRFDLCLLGMGDDCHTASLFPNHPHTPIVETMERIGAQCFAVEIAGKGMRLTLTPSGLGACGEIIITVTGSAKAKALKAVFKEEIDTSKRPVQLLGAFAEKVTWLIDPAAAGDLFD